MGGSHTRRGRREYVGDVGSSALPGNKTLDPRAQQLYDEGARLLAAKWDDAVGLVYDKDAEGGAHSIRGSLAYADVLLRAGDEESIARAERILAIVASAQETREGDAHYGNFRWFFEDEAVRDLNGVEFVLDTLNAIIRDHADVLSDSVSASIRQMIKLGLHEIDRLAVHLSYTNIALSDICNSVLGGEAIGDPAFVERGRRRLEDWLAFTDASGAPHEFNSPTYAAVDIARMAALATHTADREIALKARIAAERLWLHSAAHYHPALAQVAGPHCRSYRDGWTGAGGYLKLMLWRLLGDDNLRRATPYMPAGREEGHTGVALSSLACPAYVQDLLREKRFPFEARETPDAAHGLDLTTYMTEGYALGTASRSYAVGEPREQSRQFNALHLYFAREEAPGYGALHSRYIVNDKDAHAGADGDLWDEGRHVAAQHRNKAIIAYGLVPRIRPVTSYKLSVRVLGIGERAEVWCGDTNLTPRGRAADPFPEGKGRTLPHSVRPQTPELEGRPFPHSVRPKEPVIIAEGGVYIALIPLAQTDMGSDAPIELNLRGGVLTLDMYNYRGPAKMFWEYASLGGAFYKGNVRSAFIIEVAERGEYRDLAAFRRHIAGARITDSVDDRYAREIVYAAQHGGEIAMRYSLWDMQLIERRFDGKPYVAPPVRAGAASGGGAQWTSSSDTQVALGNVRLSSPGATTLFVDADRRRYVVLRTVHDIAPLRLETGRTTVECAAFGFGRLELDEREGTVNVEAAADARCTVAGAARLVLDAQ